ncbi:MAG: NADPH-dependent FMN reductase [Woeseiaceae bacterium]
MSLNIAVIYGSVRRDRQGIKAARFMVRKLEERGHAVSLIDPKEHPLPLLDLRFKEYDAGEAPAPMQAIHDMLQAADAFILVSGEYNHGIPPALKNLLDHYLPEFYRKAAGIVSYSAGSFAGARVHASLREVLANFGAPVLPATLVVSSVQNAFDDDGNVLDDAYNARGQKFLDEFEWFANALTSA